LRYFFVLLAICCLCCTKVLSRAKGKPLLVTFELRCGSQPFHLGEQYSSGGNTLKVEALRFYISAIALYDGDKLLWEEPDSYHLIDAATPGSLQLSLTPTAPVHFNAIRFRLGVDSLANVSGALGGDLDPSKGMYWAWQSGYINFKVEGTSPACHTRNNEFQFHLGGYAGRDASAQDIKLDAVNKNGIIIIADIGRFFERSDLFVLSSVMTPGPEAVSLSQRAAAIFRVKQ
jgi:hypothetical protein